MSETNTMTKQEKKLAKKNDPNRLGFGHLMLWKSSDIAQAWVSLLSLNYLTIYASDTLGISVALVGTLLLASKIIDAFTDIFAGWLIDNTNTRFGKGRPYELCIFGMTICTILMFTTSEAWSMTVKCAWIFCMYTLTFSVFSTLRAAGSSPYTIRHFKNNKTVITKMSSYGGIIIMICSMIVSMIFPTIMATIATSASGWSRAIMIIMVPASLIAVLRFIFCKEDDGTVTESSHQKISLQEIFTMLKRNKYVWVYAIIMLCYNIMTNLAVGTYYFKWVIGDVRLMGVTSASSVILLPLMLVFPKLMKKFGSMSKMIGVFCLISIAGFAIVFFSNTNPIGVIIGYMIGYIAVLPLIYYGILFIMNICTYNEMIGMARMEGSSNSVSSFMSKFGAALGSYITGMLLAAAGYISEAGVTSQPDSAIFMIRVDYALVPAIMLVIIFVCCRIFAKLEPKVEEFNAKKAQA